MGGTYGVFGKMPSVGDFFRAETPAGFVQVWDDWIQQGMLAAHRSLGAAWDDTYMTAPIWRFTLSAGLAGADPVAGVMMPSVDRVGRRFPLTLMTPVQGPALAQHLGSDAAFAEMEHLALECLGDDMGREDLIARLANLDPFSAVAPVGAVQAGQSVSITETQADGELGAGFSTALAQTRFHSPSIWTAILQEGRRSLLCEGLPQGAEQLALFDLTAPTWREVQAA